MTMDNDDLTALIAVGIRVLLSRSREMQPWIER